MFLSLPPGPNLPSRDLSILVPVSSLRSHCQIAGPGVQLSWLPALYLSPKCLDWDPNSPSFHCQGPGRSRQSCPSCACQSWLGALLLTHLYSLGPAPSPCGGEGSRELPCPLGPSGVRERKVFVILTFNGKWKKQTWPLPSPFTCDPGLTKLALRGPLRASVVCRLQRHPTLCRERRKRAERRACPLRPSPLPSWAPMSARPASGSLALLGV